MPAERSAKMIQYFSKHGRMSKTRLDIKCPAFQPGEKMGRPRSCHIFSAFLFLISATGLVLGQAKDDGSKNNPFSPSPTPNISPKSDPKVSVPVKPGPGDVKFIMQRKNPPQPDTQQPTIAQATFKIEKPAEIRSTPPSEIYKVGVGDVLFVNLKNSPHGSGYYTVRTNGTIDYPLAGENVIAADQTVDSLEKMLISAITLFPNPQVEVKVRQYSSHKITVSGLVENAGEKSLQREAIPLFVIRAEAGVHEKANKALVKRAPLLKIETYDLSDANTDNVLIYPGNSVEFAGDGSPTGGFYFIASEIGLSGQKDLTFGLTLYQAVIASGGAKGNPKKAVIRRKNENGIFTVIEHNLRWIKDGKAVDPAIVSGDVIEIRN